MEKEKMEKHVVSGMGRKPEPMMWHSNFSLNISGD